jgi:hypothetical protein
MWRMCRECVEFGLYINVGAESPVNEYIRKKVATHLRHSGATTSV